MGNNGFTNEFLRAEVYQRMLIVFAFLFGLAIASPFVSLFSLCVRDRSPKGREGRPYTALGPLGGKIAA